MLHYKFYNRLFLLIIIKKETLKALTDQTLYSLYSHQRYFGIKAMQTWEAGTTVACVAKHGHWRI